MRILDTDSDPRKEATDAYNAFIKPDAILALWGEGDGGERDDILSFAREVRRQTAALLSDAVLAIPAEVVKDGVFYGQIHSAAYIAGIEDAVNILDQAAGRKNASDS